VSFGSHPVEILIFCIGVDTGLREPAVPSTTRTHNDFLFKRKGGKECHPYNQSPPQGEGGYLLLGQYFNMSTNAAGSKQNNAFVYYGQEGENIPGGVICIRVHPSIRLIHERAVLGRKLLMSVQLHNGIKAIKEEAFWKCFSL
jgi:hypothetical protein